MVWQETNEAGITTYSLDNNGRKYTLKVRDGRLQSLKVEYEHDGFRYFEFSNLGHLLQAQTKDKIYSNIIPKRVLLSRPECDILTTSPNISNLATCIEAIENES